MKFCIWQLSYWIVDVKEGCLFLRKKQFLELCQPFSFLGTIGYGIKVWSWNPRSSLTCYFCIQKTGKNRCAFMVAGLAMCFLWVIKPCSLYYSFTHLYWQHYLNIITGVTSHRFYRCYEAEISIFTYVSTKIPNKNW